jgi:glycosyltransferase involved in cell wall biosynthesis
MGEPMKNKKIKLMSLLLTAIFLWQSAIWASPAPLPCSLRTKAFVERNGGLARLEQIRADFSNLPPYSKSTARLWAAIDLLLGRTDPPKELNQEALKEYKATQEYLLQNYPDLNVPQAGPFSIRLAADTTTGSSVITFEIRTSSNIYLFGIQTKKIASEDYSGSRISLPDAEAGKNYRLEEVVTGVCYPWEPPFYYQGSFIRGETDRFGNPLAEGQKGAWMLKPGFYRSGFNRGDFQFFRLIPETADIPYKWEDLTAEPSAGPTEHLQLLALRTERQTHHIARNPIDSVIADVVTGPVKRGQGFIVAFPNGNSGFALLDRAAGDPYEVTDIQTVTRDNQNQRGVRFNLSSSSNQISFDPTTDIVLDTLRNIREWAVLREGEKWERGEKLKEFAQDVHDLPLDVHVALRREGISLYEMLLRTHPVIRTDSDAQYHYIYILRYTLEGRLYLVEMKLPISYKVEQTKDGKFSIDSRGERLSCEVTVTTNFTPLHLLNRDELFTPEALQFAQQSPAFARKLNELVPLASREFFSAGSHRFLQYFSRDTLIWLLLFESALTPKAHETALQGILNRISADGELPSVEEVHDQVAYELIDEFCTAAHSARISPPSGDAYRRVKDIARTLNVMPSQRCKYGIPDVNLMLLPVMVDYLERQLPSGDQAETDQEQVAFLRALGDRGVTNLTALLRNVDLVAGQAEAYVAQRRAQKPWPTGLIGVEKEGDFANWRDRLRHGKYPTDVNAELMPLALEAARYIFERLLALPFGDDERRQIDSIANKYGWPNRLGATLTLWKSVGAHTLIQLSPSEIRSRLKEYLTKGKITSQERHWFLQQPVGSNVTLGDFLLSEDYKAPIIEDGVGFFPISLNPDGTPVPIVVSDRIFGLFDEEMDPGRLLQILTPLFLPYPAGLWTPTGVLAASPTLSNKDNLWDEVTKNTYGGSVVYGWQMEFLKQGLARQLRRFAKLPPEQQDRQLMEILYSAMEACYSVTLPSGTSDSSHELRTWNVDETGFRSISFGTLAGHNDESNPVQLWSISSNEMAIDSIRSMAKEMGLNLLGNGELLDSIAQARRRHPVTPISDVVATETLPRFAVVTHSLWAGGGSNIVAKDQVTTGSLFGYPVKVLTGQFLDKNKPAAEKAETQLARMGVDFATNPSLDIRPDIEARAWAGNLYPNDPGFREEVEGLKAWLREQLKDVDVILIHQMMVMPSNPAATVAFSELAREFYGKKRFIAWVHNILNARIASWPFNMITTMDPHIDRYVAVSPSLRDSTAELFGVDPSFIDSVNNSRSQLTFANISEKAFKFFVDNELYDADSIWFYPCRMARTKFVEAAIYAVDEAMKQGMDVRLVIATPAIHGRLPTEGEERDYLEELTKLRDSLGLTDKIIFYPHEGPEDEIWSLYNLTDAIVFTTKVETFGIPVVEAGMAGNLIIRANLPELERLVKEKGTGAHVVVNQFWSPHPENSEQYRRDVENYGRYIARETLSRLRQNPLFLETKQYKRYILKQVSSEVVFSGAVSHLLNVPPAENRQPYAGSRNFPGELIQDSMRNSARAGFLSFEINFEGFKPSDISEDGEREIASAKGDLALSLRLTDFPNWDERTQVAELQRAAGLAKKIGTSTITVRLKDLNDRAAAIVKTAAESNPDIFFAVEFGKAVEPARLNSAFGGTPVGISLWLDAIIQNPVEYVEQVHMKVAALYIGENFLGNAVWNHMENAATLLRWMRERGWEGNIINHRHRGPLETRRIGVDSVTYLSYISPVVCQALHIGDIMTKLTLTAAPLHTTVKKPDINHALAAI